MQIARAAITYFAIIFALGFVLGTVRVLRGAEALGETTFILLELSVILVASWVAARKLVGRFGIARAGEALVMGAIAFALLIAAEVLLTAALGESVAQWIAGLLEPPGVFGFAGQVLFGLMPWLVIQTGRSG
ncbi:hypothetical protein [Altererythrobacter sp. GH1-8]|uniref:hypothetical protein n=1 Tax=Altererythrobacter sp. GH1-8 TaxID=3349333 RepID=UPI00374CA444